MADWEVITTFMLIPIKEMICSLSGKNRQYSHRPTCYNYHKTHTCSGSIMIFVIPGEQDATRNPGVLKWGSFTGAWLKQIMTETLWRLAKRSVRQPNCWARSASFRLSRSKR